MNARELELVREETTPRNPYPGTNSDGSRRRWPSTLARKLDGYERDLAEAVTAPGATLTSVADKFGVTDQTLARFMRQRMPFVYSRAYWKNSDRAEVIATILPFLDDGKTVDEISKTTGYSHYKVRMTIRQIPNEVREAWRKKVEATHCTSCKSDANPYLDQMRVIRRTWATAFWRALPTDRQAFVVAYLEGR